MGIEPTLSAWKAEVLPLNYTRKKKMVGMTGFEPATPWSQTRCSTKLSHIPTLIKLMVPTKALMVQSARLELARFNNHYPLKIACLPVPPRLPSENILLRGENMCT